MNKAKAISADLLVFIKLGSCNILVLVTFVTFQFRSTMVLGRSTIVLGRSTMVLGRSTMVLGRSTMVSADS